MPKFTLIAEHVDEFAQNEHEATVRVEFTVEQLDDVIGYMQDFLKGTGYNFKGSLYVSDE